MAIEQGRGGIQEVVDAVLRFNDFAGAQTIEDIITGRKYEGTSIFPTMLVTKKSPGEREKNLAMDAIGVIVPPVKSRGIKSYEPRKKWKPAKFDDQEAVRKFDRLMELNRKHNLSGNSPDSPSQ